MPDNTILYRIFSLKYIDIYSIFHLLCQFIMILRVYLLCFRFYTSITTICEKERKSSLNDQYLCLKDEKGCCNERRVQLGPKRPKRAIQPTKENSPGHTSKQRRTSLPPQQRGDARLHLPKESPLETHVSSQSAASLKNRRRTSPSPSLQKVPQFTDSNCRTPPINRTCYLIPNCPISCQRSAAE